ncbi:LamG domain-containing protein [Streptomyces sp. INA 01156]
MADGRGRRANQAAGSAPERTLALHGGATPGAPGAKGTAVSFDGVDDYAVSDIPTVDTSTGFSVSAWAKLSTMPDQAAIVAAQPGNYAPGFELYYSKGYDRWVFNQYQEDATGAGIVRAMAPSPGGVEAGKWTHLVGTYSLTDKQLKLYVNGELVGTTAYSTPWNARRVFRSVPVFMTATGWPRSSPGRSTRCRSSTSRCRSAR